MDIKQLVKSILRARVLSVHPMTPGYDEPSAKHRDYLVLGADNDIQDFEAMVLRAWPKKHGVFLI
jgi:hypothetical protein